MICANVFVYTNCFYLFKVYQKPKITSTCHHGKCLLLQNWEDEIDDWMSFNGLTIPVAIAKPA